MLFQPRTILIATILFGQAIGHSLLERDESQTRVLTAIIPRSDLKRRTVNLQPRHDWEHHYADHESLTHSTSTRFAKTTMNYKLPALTLEDMENYLENIECSDSAIFLRFESELVLKHARRDWDRLSKFLLISSHPGCNKNGERAPYEVSDIAYSISGKSAVFTVSRIEWKEAYVSMTVDFGMADNKPGGQYAISGLRFHHLLGRRQAIPSTTVVYPSPPTSTPTNMSSVTDIGFSYLNKSIITWDESHNGLTGKVTVGCKNCSLAGEIQITEGTFTVNSSATSDFEKASQFIEHGFFNVVTKGVNAHIEIDTSVSLSATLPFLKDIFVLALPGFQIPGIAVVGPQFNAGLKGSITIEKEVDLTYGFDFTIPDGSSINFDIANLTNSSSQGFSETTLTAIPFDASTDGITLSLSLGLRSEVLLGVDILSGLGSIHAGTFLDLPEFSVSISSLSNVNAQCEPLNSSDSTSGFLSHVFPSLLHIIPSADLGLGLEVGAALKLPAVLATDVAAIAIVSSTILTGTSWALETACLSWNSKATAFVNPTISASTSFIAEPTGTGSMATGNKGNFGVRLQDKNPFVHVTGVVWATTVITGCILLATIAL